MGKRSLTKKAWKTQRCFASEVQFIDRKAKRSTKGRNANKQRQQAKKEVVAQSDEDKE